MSGILVKSQEALAAAFTKAYITNSKISITAVGFEFKCCVTSVNIYASEYPSARVEVELIARGKIVKKRARAK